MKRNVDEIIKELIALDASFAAHEDALRGLIAELISKRPDTHLDEEFVARLRSQLLEQKPTPSPFMQFSYFQYAIPVLAILLVVPFGYYILQGNPSGGAVFTMTQDIQRVESGAYGTLALEGGGKGGGMESATMSAMTTTGDTSIAPMAASADMANTAAAPGAKLAEGAGYSDARMMLPQGPVTVNTFVYKGDPLELAEATGQVYSRTKTPVSSGQIASQLKKFNFGLLDLGAYSNLRVRSFELVEDKPFGYAINANFDEGMISINPNYTEWPALNGKEIQQQLPKSAMPSNEAVLAIANAFLAEHGVSLANYGEPIVQDYGNYAGAADSEMQFAPEQVTVTYPLKIAGTPVYEDGAYPYGIQVGVSVRDNRVMSVYGLSSQTYTSSDYQLTTDSDKVLSILAKGGVNAWIPQEGDGVTIKKAEIEVGTPTKVLMHTYTYANNTSQELFVPALSFPVTKAPVGNEYYPKYIIIPLATDILNQAPNPVMYDMMVR